jgi:hypothetical protein
VLPVLPVGPVLPVVPVAPVAPISPDIAKDQSLWVPLPAVKSADIIKVPPPI